MDLISLKRKVMKTSVGSRHVPLSLRVPTGSKAIKYLLNGWGRNKLLCIAKSVVLRLTLESKWGENVPCLIHHHYTNHSME